MAKDGLRRLGRAPGKPGGAARSVFVWLAVGCGVVAVLSLWLMPWPGSRSPESESVDAAAADRVSPRAASADSLPLASSDTGRTRSAPPGAADAEVGSLLQVILNEESPMRDRATAARALGMSGRGEALEAARRVLREAPSPVKAALAEGLGASPNPDSRSLLLEILTGPDETAARGAVRGLGARGEVEVPTLAEYLQDVRQPLSTRSEAALVLGEVPGEAAYATLVDAVNRPQEEDLIEFVLEGLGKRPLQETAEFLRGYLANPEVDSELKAAAIEGLFHSSSDTGAFLVECVQHRDAQVRAAAAWALSTSDARGDYAALLLGQLTVEPDRDVRRRLYQALANQNDYSPAPLLDAALAEEHLDVRLAGLSAVARAVGAGPGSGVAQRFDQDCVTALWDLALHANDLGDRLEAVVALRAARTPGSLTALAGIARDADDRKVVEAAQLPTAPGP